MQTCRQPFIVLRMPEMTSLTDVINPIIAFTSPAASAFLGYTPVPFPSTSHHSLPFQNLLRPTIVGGGE